MYCIPLNSARSPARCLGLNGVSIDPSELYHITQSYCPLNTSCEDFSCACYRLFTGFPSASWFGWLFALCTLATGHFFTDCLRYLYDVSNTVFFWTRFRVRKPNTWAKHQSPCVFPEFNPEIRHLLIVRALNIGCPVWWSVEIKKKSINATEPETIVMAKLIQVQKYWFTKTWGSPCGLRCSL